MAARFLTSRLQRSGYRFLIRRIEQAFTRRDVRGLSNPFSAQTSALSVGIFLVGLIAVVGLLVSFIKPRPDRGLDSIVTTQSGGMYVMFGGTPEAPEARLHPVTNLASARLIVGKPENASVIKDSSLEGIPRGPLMGIPSAPNSLAAHTDDPATWTLCDRRDAKSDLSLTTAGSIKTTLIAGKDEITEGAEKLEENQALLVRSETAPDALWLVFNGKRAEVGRQDFATHAALGLTPAKINSAMALSGGLVDAIEVLPTLTIPFIPDRGRVSTAAPKYANGDIVTIGSVDGTGENYVIVDNGAQRISSVIAALLINTGSRHIVEASPDAVTSLPQVQVIDTSRYPANVPDIKTPPTVCYSWAKGRHDMSATTTVYIGEDLPIDRDKEGREIIDLLPPNEGIIQADASLMEPGKGWYVRVTGTSATSMSEEQLMYIDDTGTRYFISVADNGSYDPVVSALGLNWQLPMPIPWAIAKMYVHGATLDPKEALVQHAYIPPNPGGVPVEPKTGSLTPPPGQG